MKVGVINTNTRAPLGDQVPCLLSLSPEYQTGGIWLAISTLIMEASCSQSAVLVLLHWRGEGPGGIIPFTLASSQTPATCSTTQISSLVYAWNGSLSSTRKLIRKSVPFPL
ncbi:hypothetical protein AMECASPLE_025913 [Ameca splendens]|uniref:Uncharacterized protein n=1 Tax=Ameca splendens TaxID=208324 RepID=A0ABV1ACH8_9TELE